MYKATVEAISGLKVRAGGKWLTCIGNRAMKVGDRIWTDGRCAYGHDRETQAPIVVASSPKDELIVPLCSPNSWVRETSIAFSQYRSRKKAVESTHEIQGNTLPEVVDPYWRLIKEADYLMAANSDEVVFSNAPYSGHVQAYRTDIDGYIGRRGLNIDKHGNIYELRHERVFTGGFATRSARIQIITNGDVAKTFYMDTMEYVELNNELRDSMISDWDFLNFAYEGTYDCSSFIENEDNWWIIYVLVSKFYYTSSGREFWKVIINLVDSRGKHRLITCDSGVLAVDKEIKIPMQDGFYFKIKNTAVDILSSNLTISLICTIHSPGDMALMTTEVKLSIGNSGRFSERFYFSGCQINSREFLISSRTEGLFLCDGNRVKQVFHGNVANQNLCLWKKRCKNWWKRIRILE